MTKYIKCAFGAHYLALSRSILQGAGFKHYLCKRKDGTDPPHPVGASNWKVLPPSQGTEAHSVLLLKDLVRPCMGGSDNNRSTAHQCKSVASVSIRRRQCKSVAVSVPLDTTPSLTKQCPPPHETAPIASQENENTKNEPPLPRSPAKRQQGALAVWDYK